MSRTWFARTSAWGLTKRFRFAFAASFSRERKRPGNAGSSPAVSRASRDTPLHVGTELFGRASRNAGRQIPEEAGPFKSAGEGALAPRSCRKPRLTNKGGSVRDCRGACTFGFSVSPAFAGSRRLSELLLFGIRATIGLRQLSKAILGTFNAMIDIWFRLPLFSFYRGCSFQL